MNKAEVKAAVFDSIRRVAALERLTQGGTPDDFGSYNFNLVRLRENLYFLSRASTWPHEFPLHTETRVS